MKNCYKCKELKPFNDFYIRKASLDGLTQQCKDCLKKSLKEFRKQRPEYSSIWRKKNAEKVREYERDYSKTDKHKSTRNKRQKERFQTDIIFRLRVSLRTRLKKAIIHDYKSGSAIRDLGCSIEELKIYLEKQFKEGMSWDNYGLKGWHIDHIKPLSGFNLSNRNELLVAVHYTNLQPLWAVDNIKKSNK